MKEPGDDSNGSGDEDKKLPAALSSASATITSKRKRAPDEATSYEKRWTEMFQR